MKTCSEGEGVSRFGWAVDGFGHSFIMENNDRICILSMVGQGGGMEGKMLLEEQEAIGRTEFFKFSDLEGV